MSQVSTVRRFLLIKSIFLFLKKHRRLDGSVSQRRLDGSNSQRRLDSSNSQRSLGKVSEFSRMNTKEWKYKADGLISKWESGIFKIEIEFDSFLYKLAQEEQQEMHETSALFQRRLDRNKEKIHEFQPLSPTEISGPDKDILLTPRSIQNSNVDSEHSAKMTSIKSKKLRTITSRNSPNRFLKSSQHQDKTFHIDSPNNLAQSSVIIPDAPLKLPSKLPQKKRGGWLCMGLNFCMGQPDDGSEAFGEKLGQSRISQSCLNGEYFGHRLTEPAWSDFRCSRGFFGPDDSLRLVEKTNFNSMIIERTEACENEVF